MINYLYHLTTDQIKDKFYIVWPDGSICFGPYKTSAAAKSELTKMRKS
jgi:hypothetical protein